jgi:hypothetical protein
MSGLVFTRPAAAGYTHAGPSETPTPSPEESPSPSPSPSPDPELDRLTREAKLAEARKTIAQAENDEATARKAKAEADKAATEARLADLKAKLGLGEPTPSATPPSGNITGDVTNFIETQVLAETSAKAAGMALFEQICLVDGDGQTPSPAPMTVPALQKTPINKLVINSPTDKAAIGRYRAILAQLKFLHTHYAKLIKQANDESKEATMEVAALPLLIPAATSLVKNAAELVSLFRTETEFKNQNITTVNTRLVVSHLTNYLLTRQSSQCKVKEIYQPAVYPLSPSADATGSQLYQAYTALLNDITDGDAAVNNGNTRIAALRKDIETIDARNAELRKKIADEKQKKEQAEKDKGKKKKKTKKSPQQPAEPFDEEAAKKEIKENEEEKAKINTKIERIQQAAASVEDFKKSLADLLKLLTAVDDTTKQPLLIDLVASGRLSDILAEDGTYALDLGIRASGTNRIRRNMFFNAKLAHSAGATIDANLYDSQDRLVFGRVEDFYVEFTGSEDIRKRKGFKKLDEIPR